MKKTTILSLVFFASAFAHAQGLEDYPSWPGMMGWSHGMGWFMHVLMIVSWIVVIVGIIVIFRWLVRPKSNRVKGGEPEDSALGLLKRRYAKGEIDKDEFEEKKKILEE